VPFVFEGVLDTDPASGLQMTVRSCSVPWSSASSCDGKERTVVAAGRHPLTIRQANPAFRHQDRDNCRRQEAG
jgi:hypothetical protein